MIIFFFFFFKKKTDFQSLPLDFNQASFFSFFFYFFNFFFFFLSAFSNFFCSLSSILSLGTLCNKQSSGFLCPSASHFFPISPASETMVGKFCTKSLTSIIAFDSTSSNRDILVNAFSNVIILLAKLGITFISSSGFKELFLISPGN